jgi:tRNA(fMet)-specific endonuclease VapC
MTILDTDVCVELLRGNKRVIEHRRRFADETAISFMTVGELFYGAVRSNHPEHNRELVERFLLSVICLQSDQPLMEKFGVLKAELATRGEMLPDADVLIAATAMNCGGSLVSGNRQHFARFAGLTVLDWTR